MATLNWNSTGEKFYETGVDRGVLYPKNLSYGVAWNGLISVKESFTGGQATGYYIDGVKYLNKSSYEELNATIDAFSSPLEFDHCDGSLEVLDGINLSTQTHTPFNFTYRTKIGNDVNGVDHGYKIHIIYNALASPTNIENVTVSDNTTPVIFSWSLTSKPEELIGYEPSSYFVIDSTKTDPVLLRYFENIIYGTTQEDPKLPSGQEVIDIFGTSLSPLTVTDNGDGTWTASGDDRMFNIISSTEFEITSSTAVMIDKNAYNISSS